MTEIPFGAIVLTDFPFTDLSAAKRRPALVVSTDNDRRADIIVAYISSVLRGGSHTAPISPTPGNGLKLPSVVRFDKIATLDKSIVSGRLGVAEPDWLRQHRDTFFGVFGFSKPEDQL